MLDAGAACTTVATDFPRGCRVAGQRDDRVHSRGHAGTHADCLEQQRPDAERFDQEVVLTRIQQWLSKPAGSADWDGCARTGYSIAERYDRVYHRVARGVANDNFERTLGQRLCLSGCGEATSQSKQRYGNSEFFVDQEFQGSRIQKRDSGFSARAVPFVPALENPDRVGNPLRLRQFDPSKGT